MACLLHNGRISFQLYENRALVFNISGQNGKNTFEFETDVCFQRLRRRIKLWTKQHNDRRW